MSHSSKSVSPRTWLSRCGISLLANINLNDFPRALETYRDARAYCERYHMPLLATEADYNVAYLYYVRGEYPRAIELYRATRDRCRAAGDTYHEGLCDLDQSEMWLEFER